MIWATRIFAVLGCWFVLSIVVCGILPALRHLRRRNVVWVNTTYIDDDGEGGGGPVVIDDDDQIDAELRAFFERESDR